MKDCDEDQKKIDELQKAIQDKNDQIFRISRACALGENMKGKDAEKENRYLGSAL